ncbi:MAG TPA: gamma-glutamyltransferase [Acidobacteriota bacterium]|nr:gamma-glutamyltransferase [Acidobacteriota bacterium]
MRKSFVGLLVWALLTALLGGLLESPLRGADQPPVRARKGMVVSTNPYASDVGREILQKGGNAVDAAVAVGFALAVVHPAAGNIGGGGFMVLHDAQQGREYTVDYREMAPAAAHRDMYLDEEGKAVPERSRMGYLASGVPGSVAGMHLAWQRFGKLEWKELVEPAIRLADEGFEVSDVLADSLRRAARLLGQFPESKRIFLKGGQFWSEGETFRQPELAETLRRIAEQGPDGFYRGETARLIAEDMKAHGGNITEEDLENYQPKMREPVRGTYRGYEVVSMGPPSSGGVILVEMLNMIEPYPIAHLGFGSSRGVHLKAEVMRRAFADRAEFLGDPDFNDLPTDALVSKDYARRWEPSIETEWASPSSYVSHGDAPGYESDDTTHYSVVDADGNGVAVTTTINGGYGSGVTVKGAGFLLNNEMDDFTSKPGVPNLYGLIQGEANSVGAGKRPLSAMTPTIVKKDGQLFMVLGSPGGPTIINTVFQIILNVVDHGMNIQEAVNAPRVHHQWLPDQIRAESDALVMDVVHALQNKGHRITFTGGIGDAHCILVDPDNGMRYGAPDPRRGEAKASGY